MILLPRRRVLGLGVAMLAAPAILHPAHAHDLQTVDIRDFGFHPEDLTAHPGNELRFVNADLVPHTATARNGSWDTGRLDPGQEITLTTTADWGAEFYCIYHPRMTGHIEVQAE